MSREKKGIKLGVLHVEDRKNVICKVRKIFDKKVADLKKDYPGAADIDFVLHPVLMKHNGGKAVEDNDEEAIQEKVSDSLGLLSSQDCKLAAIILDFLFGREDLPNGQAYTDMKLETTGGFKFLQIMHDELEAGENRIFIVTFSRFVSNKPDLRELFSSFFPNFLLLEWRDPDNETVDKIEKAVGTLLKAIYRDHMDIQTNFLTVSDKCRKILDQVKAVCLEDSTVLIQGESGTGKELLARTLHQNSRRRDKPFVVVNCAVVPETLIESELFGHVKGAFTGAISEKIGQVELADKATLFLDEIGELPLASQQKLLRFLESREFQRVGGTETKEVDVRLIAATNRDLQAEIKKGAFREDLYYRLHVMPINPPPLRERRKDIPFLTKILIKKMNDKLKKFTRPIQTNEEVVHIFTQYRWPGNVRELEHTLERMILLAPSPELTVALIPQHIKDPADDFTGSNGYPENDVGDGPEEVWNVFKDDPELYGKFFEYERSIAILHENVNDTTSMKTIRRKYFKGTGPKGFYTKLRNMFGHDDRFPEKKKSNSGGAIEFFKQHTREELMEIVVQGLKDRLEEREDTT